MFRRLLFFMVLALAGLGVGSGDLLIAGDPESPQVGRAVEGSNLTPAVTPQLRAALQSVLDRIAVAAHQLYPAVRNVSWKLEISHTNEMQAFVLVQDKKRSEHNGHLKSYSDVVTLSTGMLNFLFSRVSDENSLQEFFAHIAGILAHELGHSIDYSYRTRGFGESQLAEVWADGAAIGLLRQGGLATNSLYRALNLIEEKARNPSDPLHRLAEAFFSTHPSSRVREIQAEIGIALDRFERGEGLTHGVLANQETIRAELAAIPELSAPARKTRRSEIYPNIATVLRQLELALSYAKTYFHQSKSSHSDINLAESPFLYDEVSEVLLALHEKINDAGTDLSPQDQEKIFSFISQFIANTPSEILNASRDNSKHLALLHSAPFYRSEAFQAALRERLDFYFQELDRGILQDKLHDPFENLLSSFCTVDVFTHRLRSYLAQMPRSNGSDLNRLADFLRRIQGAARRQAYQIPLAVLSQEILEGLSESERTDFLLYFDQKKTHTHAFYSEPLLLRLGFKAESTAKNHDTISRPPETNPSEWGWANGYEEVQAAEVARSIWKDRGYYATYDLMRDAGVDMDWPFIFETVGLSRQEGKRQLNDSMRAFLRSENYTHLLAMASGRNKNTMPESTGGTTRSEKRFFWFEENLWPDILGQNNPFITQELRAVVRSNIAPLFLKEKLATFRTAYLERLKSALRETYEAGPQDFSIAKIRQTLAQSVVDIGGLNFRTPVYDLQIEALRSLNLPHQQITELLRAFYYRTPTYRQVPILQRLVGLQNPLNDSKGTGNSKPENIAGSSSSINVQTEPHFFAIPGHESEMTRWVLMSENSHNVRIYKQLYDAGIVEKPSLFLGYVRKSPSTLFKTEIGPEHFQMVNDFSELLMQEFKEIDSAPTLLRFAEDVFPNTAFDNEIRLAFAMPSVSKIVDAVVERARSLPGSATNHAIKLFETLTAQGTSLSTDAYFEEVIRPILQAEPGIDSLARLRSYITDPPPTLERTTFLQILKPTAKRGKRIGSPRIRAEIAREILDEELVTFKSLRDILAAGSPHDHVDQIVNSNLPKLLESIESMTEVGTARDDLIEYLAWSLEIKDPGLLRQMENKKSTHWHFVNSTQIRQGSALSNLAENLSGTARHDAIEYFMNPHGHLPESVKDSVAHSIRKATSPSLLKLASDLQKLQQKIGESIRDLEIAANSAGPHERIPVLMLLMRSGDGALMAREDFPKNILREHLGSIPDSIEERAFLAFLRTSPPEEVPLALAYRMAMRHQNEGLRWRPMFEVFTGVGIKAGQLAGLFRLLGPEATAELRGLQNEARPLSLHQITEIFNETLTPTERARIKRPVRILGSASMKSVVEVELTDGARVAVMVQRPHAQAQIKLNLKRARALITELRASNITVPGFMDQIIDGTERQMADEVRMTHEAGNIEMAQAMYQSLNQSMKEDLKGWRFEVPGLAQGFTPRDHLLFTELAQGTTLRAMQNQDTKAHVARMITKASIRGMFRHGHLNPDPHGGNYIIDEANKVIRPIDFGQLETYETAPIRDFLTSALHGDDAYNLSQFLRAISERNADNILRFGHRLSTQNADNKSTNNQALRLEIKTLLESNPPENDLLIGVMDTLSRNHSPLEHRFSFGALKGLLILHEEEHLSGSDFSEILNSEIRSVLNSRRTLTITDQAISSAQSAINCITNALKLKN